MSDYAGYSVPSEQNSQAVSVTTTSAASTPLKEGVAIVTVTALCFVVRGQNPTAVANTSMALAPNIPHRLRGLIDGDKLAFICGTGTASAYITQDC